MLTLGCGPLSIRRPTERLSAAPTTNSHCASLPNVAIRLEKASIDGYVKSHSGRYSSWRIRNGAPSACASAAANGFTICGATRSFAPPATRHSHSAAARPKRRLRTRGVNRKKFFRVGRIGNDAIHRLVFDLISLSDIADIEFIALGQGPGAAHREPVGRGYPPISKAHSHKLSRPPP